MEPIVIRCLAFQLVGRRHGIVGRDRDGGHRSGRRAPEPVAGRDARRDGRAAGQVAADSISGLGEHESRLSAFRERECQRGPDPGRAVRNGGCCAVADPWAAVAELLGAPLQAAETTSACVAPGMQRRATACSLNPFVKRRCDPLLAIDPPS